MTRWALLRHAPRTFLRLCRADDAELGAAGEELAARHLSSRGWRILGRRVRTGEGELDLVCKDGQGERTELVCVEVKTSRVPAGAEPTARRWRPGERLDRDRLVRQRRAARQLAGRKARGRVDLFEVWIRAGRPPEFVHHADVLRPLEHGITPIGESVTKRGSGPRELRR